MANIVSLDMAPFKCGFATANWGSEAILHQGLIQEPAMMEDCQRSRNVFLRAINLILDNKPSLVIIEDTRIRFGNRDQNLQAYYNHKNIGAIEEYCQSRTYPIQVEFCPISSWKAKFYPKGWKTLKKKGLFKEKDEAIKIAIKQTGLNILSDDAAEAILMILYHLRKK